MTPERLRELWLAGCKLDQIGAEAGLAKSSVSVWAKRLGLPSRRGPRTRPQSNRVVDHERIVAMAREGRAYHEIGRAVGCSTKYAHCIARRHGVPRRQHSAASLPQRDIVRAYCEGGMSSNEIGKRTGLAHSTILRVLRLNGVRIRGCAARHECTPEQLRRVLALWNRGWSQADIGAAMGLRVWQVRWRLHKSIPVPSRGIGAKREAWRRRQLRQHGGAA